MDKSANTFFDKLYTHRRAAMYAVALAIVGDKITAEDVVHQTFVKLLRSKKVRTLKGTALDAFVMIALRHNAIDVVRRRRRIRAATVEYQDEQHGEVSESMELVALMDELGVLPHALHDALILRYIYGFKHREIGELLGISEEAARKRSRRGLDLLEAYWCDMLGGVSVEEGERVPGPK